MCKVIREADQDVFDLLDSEYVEQQIPEDVVIFFACVEPNNREEDTWENDEGTMSYLIVLPYEQVKGRKKEEVRELMLSKAQERLMVAA